MEFFLGSKRKISIRAFVATAATHWLYELLHANVNADVPDVLLELPIFGQCRTINFFSLI